MYDAICTIMFHKFAFFFFWQLAVWHRSLESLFCQLGRFCDPCTTEHISTAHLHTADTLASHRIRHGSSPLTLLESSMHTPTRTHSLSPLTFIFMLNLTRGVWRISRPNIPPHSLPPLDACTFIPWQLTDVTDRTVCARTPWRGEGRRGECVE